jgi:N-sulfoglucosamine sulfohydrolase
MDAIGSTTDCGAPRGRVALVLAITLAWRAALAGAPRNLLLVTADDLNADSAGWMRRGAPATPRLDALAAASHRFVNAHVTAPICQPSRSALMTGRVPHRSGALGFDPVADDVPTLVEVLRGRGYLTAAINKLGHLQPREKFPWDVALRGSGRHPKAMRRHLGRCLAAARRADRPFFIDANLTDPHRPFRHARRGPPPGGSTEAAAPVPVPTFLEDLPRVREELADYFASVVRLDAGLGQVLDGLEAAGHTGDTVVVFLSDNGMSFPFAKASVYRNGTWSPVLLRSPGLPPPAVHEQMVSSVDLMPTVLELLGVPAPAGMDGRSWVPLLRGLPQPGRDFVVTHVNTVRSGASFPQRCARTRARSLIYQPWADGHRRFRVEAMHGWSFRAMREAARDDPGIAARLRQLERGSPLALYDLERDPDERHNVIDVPAYRGDVERLQARLLRHMQGTADPESAPFRAAISVWRAGAGARCPSATVRGGFPQALAMAGCPRCEEAH